MILTGETNFSRLLIEIEKRIVDWEKALKKVPKSNLRDMNYHEGYIHALKQMKTYGRSLMERTDDST